MKKVLLIAALFTATTAVAFAQTAPGINNEPTAQPVSEGEDKSKKIEFSALPEAVQTAFKASTHKDSPVKEVFEVTKTDGNIYKIVVDVKGTATTLKYNAKGELLKD